MRFSRKSILEPLNNSKFVRLGVFLMFLLIAGSTTISAQSLSQLNLTVDNNALSELHCNGDVVTYTIKWTLTKPACDTMPTMFRSETLTLKPGINRGTIQSVSFTTGGMTSNPPVAPAIALIPNTSGTVVVTVQWTDIVEEEGDLLLNFEYSAKARCNSGQVFQQFNDLLRISLLLFERSPKIFQLALRRSPGR